MAKLPLGNIIIIVIYIRDSLGFKREYKIGIIIKTYSLLGNIKYGSFTEINYGCGI